MRNFEQRKAEIFRRSEKRIKARKKTQRRIVAACIPLFVCAAVLSVVLRPKNEMPPQVESYTSDQEMDVLYSEVTSSSATGVTNADSASLSTGIIVKASDGALKNYNYDTDRQRYEAIFDNVISAFGETDTGATDVNDNCSAEATKENEDTAGTSTQTDENQKNAEYTVIIYKDGIKNVYTLKNKTLTCEQTKRQVTLQDEEYKTLIELFDMQ